MSSILRKTIHFAVIALSLAAATSAVGADKANGFAGRWSLQRERSVFSASSLPDAMSISIELESHGLHYRSDAVWIDGRHTSAEFTASMDGVPAAVAGSTGLLAPVSLHPMDDLDIEASYMLGPKRIALSQWSLDPNNTELRIATRYSASDGTQATTLAIFERVQTNMP